MGIFYVTEAGRTEVVVDALEIRNAHAAAIKLSRRNRPIRYTVKAHRHIQRWSDGTEKIVAGYDITTYHAGKRVAQTLTDDPTYRISQAHAMYLYSIVEQALAVIAAHDLDQDDRVATVVRRLDRAGISKIAWADAGANPPEMILSALERVGTDIDAHPYIPAERKADVHDLHDAVSATLKEA